MNKNTNTVTWPPPARAKSEIREELNKRLEFKLGSKARHDPITENVMLNICEQFEDENDYDFQQNGAPYDYDSGVKPYLSENLPNRWIGRRGAIERPPHSPDLTPQNFFCGTKGKVYLTKPTIAKAGNVIPKKMIRRDCDFIASRCQQCLNRNGHEIEHLR
ncbi:hypothetical protein GQX74_009742 [Glossina fuscipes]|nr:hypothetical protein GQX74_009742 [Glossina fuscipes]